MSQSIQRMLKRAYKNYLKDYRLTENDLPFDTFKELFIDFLKKQGVLNNIEKL